MTTLSGKIAPRTYAPPLPWKKKNSSHVHAKRERLLSCLLQRPGGGGFAKPGWGAVSAPSSAPRPDGGTRLTAWRWPEEGRPPPVMPPRGAALPGRAAPAPRRRGHLVSRGQSVRGVAPRVPLAEGRSGGAGEAERGPRPAQRSRTRFPGTVVATGTEGIRNFEPRVWSRERPSKWTERPHVSKDTAALQSGPPQGGCGRRLRAADSRRFISTVGPIFSFQF